MFWSENVYDPLFSSLDDDSMSSSDKSKDDAMDVDEEVKDANDVKDQQKRHETDTRDEDYEMNDVKSAFRTNSSNGRRKDMGEGVSSFVKASSVDHCCFDLAQSTTFAERKNDPDKNEPFGCDPHFESLSNVFVGTDNAQKTPKPTSDRVTLIPADIVPPFCNYATGIDVCQMEQTFVTQRKQEHFNEKSRCLTNQNEKGFYCMAPLEFILNDGCDRCASYSYNSQQAESPRDGPSKLGGMDEESLALRVIEYNTQHDQKNNKESDALFTRRRFKANATTGISSLTPIVEQLKLELLKPSASDPNNVEKTNYKLTKRKQTLQSTASMRGSLSQLYIPKQVTKVQVCIVLDDTNSNMAKLYTPLKSNMEKFWTLILASQCQLSVCLVSSTSRKPFTSDKHEFMAQFSNITEAAISSKDLPRYGRLTGFSKALQNVRKIEWKPELSRFLYIFTDLACIEGDVEENQIRELNASLRETIAHDECQAEILLGTWLDHNKILEQSLKDHDIPFLTFPALDVKKMASFIVSNDKMLIDTIYASLLSNDRARRAHVSFVEQPLFFSGDPETMRPRHPTVEIIPFVATVHRAKSPESIQDLLSGGRPKFSSMDTAIVLPDVTKVHCSEKYVSYQGTIVPKRDIWLLKTLKLDHLKERTGTASRGYYENWACLSGKARFLAQEYNNKHRPQHCAFVQFVRSRVLVEAISPRRRAFFAEDYIRCPDNLETFCDAAGVWNEGSIHETLLRFVQTSFKLTGGDLMVVGLYGTRVVSTNTFILATPVLLTKTGDPNISQCNKEYMSSCRTNTKRLLKAIENRN